MNPEVKAKWIAALRSGEYKQGHRWLAHISPDDGSERFCCLGVLCEIAVEEGVTDRHRYVPDTSRAREVIAYGRGEDVCTGLLPRSVQEWAGLDSAGPVADKAAGNYELAEVNDNLQWDFNQIANLIEVGL